MTWRKMMTLDYNCVINCLVVTPLVIMVWEIIKLLVLEKIKKEFFTQKDKKEQ